LSKNIGLTRYLGPQRVSPERSNLIIDTYGGNMTKYKEKYFIIASVTPGAKLNKKLYAGIRNFMKRMSAELILIKTAPLKSTSFLDQYIPQDSIIDSAVKLNKYLHILPDSLNPSTVDHLTANTHYLQKSRQIILGIPRHTCKSYPRSLKQKDGYVPKAIYGSGSLTLPHYANNLSGKRGHSFHKNGFLIIKIINDKVAILRQAECHADGSFYYDKKRYFSNGTTEKLKSIPGISLGDIHLGETDPVALSATMSVIKHFRPKNIIYHDLFSSNSISHHLAGKNITKATMDLSLEREFREASNQFYEIIKNSPAKSKHYVVKSNHCEHLLRYLEEGRYGHDSINLRLAIFLLNKHLQGKDLIEEGLRHFNNLKNTHFLKREEAKYIHGIDISNHGDEGSSGKRATPKSLGQIFGNKVITGHQHNAEITNYGNYINGTMTPLLLPYCQFSGGTNWTHTHTLIYPSGLRSHIHIINGLWR
jgi:hypothetical protein